MPSPAALVPFIATSAFDAELERFLDLLDAHQLFTVESRSSQRQSVIYAQQLVAALRRRAYEVVKEKQTASRWPVVEVSFETWAWDNGDFWYESGATLRHFDGTVSRDVDLSFDDVSGPLTDLAGVDRPFAGDTLTVDLRTGEVST